MSQRFIVRFFILITLGVANHMAVGASDPLVSDSRHHLVRNVRNWYAADISARKASLRTQYDAVALIDLARNRLESGTLTLSDPDWSVVIRDVLLGYGFKNGVDASLRISEAETNILTSAYALSSSYSKARGNAISLQASQVYTRSSASVIAGHVAALNQAAAAVTAKEYARVQAKVLEARWLPDAYQDFLRYHREHPGTLDATLQPVVAFAKELRERREDWTALDILCFEGDGAVDLTRISQHNISEIQDFFTWGDPEELFEFLAKTGCTPRQLWLKKVLFQIIPEDKEFIVAVSKAHTILNGNAEEITKKRAGAFALFELTNKAAANIKMRRMAAMFALGVRDKEWKSFLTQAQLEEIRKFLTLAVNDRGISVKERFTYADALLWTFNADHDGRLGTDDQRKAIFEQLLEFARDISLSIDFRLSCAGTVLNGFPFITEEKRREALAIIMQEAIRTKSFFALRNAAQSALSARSKTVAEENVALASTEQREQLTAMFTHLIRTGRDYQKALTANYFWGVADLLSLDVKKEVVGVCFGLLDNPFLAGFERFCTERIILDMYHNVPSYTHVATDDQRRMVVQRWVSVIKSPDAEWWQKMNVIHEVINGRDSNGKYLAKPADIIAAIDCGVNFLCSSYLDSCSRFHLAESIFKAENPELDLVPGVFCPTSAQLRITIPILLANWTFCYDEYHRKGLAKSILDRRMEDAIHYLATKEQRLEALNVFTAAVRDETKPVDSRLGDAWVILHAKDECTGEQAPLLAVADAVKSAVAVMIRYITDESVSYYQREDQMRLLYSVPLELCTEEQSLFIKECKELRAR